MRVTARFLARFEGGLGKSYVYEVTPPSLTSTLTYIWVTFAFAVPLSRGNLLCPPPPPPRRRPGAAQTQGRGRGLPPFKARGFLPAFCIVGCRAI